MAGSKRALRAGSVARKANKSSSTDNKTSMKKKNSAVGRRGRRDNDDEDGNDDMKKSLDTKNNKSPSEEEEEVYAAASSLGDDNGNLKEEDNADDDTENTTTKAAPPQKKKNEQDESAKPKPPQPSKQAAQPPAKIKGRFMEVKMKQLTSYFSSKTTSSSSSAGGAAPVIDTSDAKGGEEENINDLPNSTVKKKRPLTVGEAESAADDDNLKKRKVNDDDDTNNNDGGIKSDHRSVNNNSDDADEKADVTQHPDTPKQPIGSNEEGGGESAIPPTSTTAAAISCPLQFLAAAVIMSPDAKVISSKSGSKIRNVDEEIVPMPKIISDLPFEDEGECEVKDDGNSGEGNKPAATDEKVNTSIGESTEGEGGESADVNIPDTTKPTTDVEGGDVDQTPKVEEAEVVSSQQTPSSEEQLANDDSPSQKIEEEEGESSTTAVDDVDMENTSQSSENKTTETTRIEGDASMDVDETTNTTSSDHLPQHEEDSTNAVIMTDDAPIHHQVSVSTAAESPPSPELLSTSSKNFETTPNTAKKAPTVSQLKMALFMEASRVHAGNKPERIFANYWDALEKYIAPPRHSSSAPRSDPSFKFNATLQLFLKTRKMKRLHNKLILALISDSLRDQVPSGHCSGEHIPRVWRGRMRHLNLKSDDDGVELDNNNNLGSNNGLYDDWNSSVGNNADAWSACGNSVTIAPRIDQDNFVAKKREEKEVEVSNEEEIIPSCRLPGALEIDLFVKKIASDAGLTVSHDSMWLLIVAAREYASSIIGKAIDNDKSVTSGLMPRIPKSYYSSLSCEHLLSDKKGGKKKDSKKKESASKADKKSKGTTERNESDKKRKVLNSADISQVLQEQHVAAPRLAWMRSMGRGMAQHQPDLKTTNDIINASIQRAAIKRRRAADMKSSESHVAPVAAAEEKVHDESALGNESLDRGAKDEPGRKAEAAIEKRPSINMNDSAKKAPPKSSDLLKSNVPPAEPTTESSTAPAQSGPSPTVDSTTTSPPASENVTQIRQISKFGAKNLAAMKARRRSGSFRGKPEQGAGKEETPEKLVRYQSRTSGPATQSLSQQPVPVPASVSLTNPPGPAPVSVTNPPPSAPAPAPAPIIVKKLSKDEMEKLARYQQAARPVTQAQQPAPAPPSVTNQSTGLEEREKSLQSQYRQQQLDSRDSTLRQQQYKPRATSNTTQLWQETEMTMQSQVEQDEEEEEEVLPQPKLARTTNQF